MPSPSRTAPTTLLLALLLGASVVVGQDPPSAAGAVRWPTPPATWWTALQGGERATYEVRQGEHAARRVLRLEKVEGSRLTLSLEERSPDGATDLGCASATIDAQGAEVQGDLNLPPGATLTRTGAETLVVGAHTLACDIYEVTIESPLGRVSMTAWHCPQLPPVFMGGTVKLKSKVGGIEATITLVDYEGKLLPAPQPGPR